MPIRLAAEADVPAVRRCVLDAFSVYADRLDRPPAPMLHDYAAQVRDGRVYVETADDAVRGVALLIARPDHLFVDTLAVDPRYQRQGIGARLLDFAEARARALGTGEVRLETNVRMTENLRYYTAHGYRETGRGPVDGYDRVFLSKRLR